MEIVDIIEGNADVAFLDVVVVLKENFVAGGRLIGIEVMVMDMIAIGGVLDIILVMEAMASVVQSVTGENEVIVVPRVLPVLPVPRVPRVPPVLRVGRQVVDKFNCFRTF